MAAVPPQRRHAFQADLLLALQAARERVVPKTQASREKTWNAWKGFCTDLGVDPYMQGVANPLDYLLVFGLRVRRGDLSKSGQPVGASTVAEYLRTVGKRLSELGGHDPRLRSGTLLPAISDFLGYLSKVDPAASRVWPVNLTIIRQLIQDCSSTDDRRRAIRDLSIMAFFFLNRPGEYALSTGADGLSEPFRLIDVSFSNNQQQNAIASSCALHAITSADTVTLTFTSQKNAVRGESISHKLSGDPTLCPVNAVQNRVIYHRLRHSPAHTPLHAYHDTQGTQRLVTTRDITQALREAAAKVQHITGIPPARIEARSLRSGGATALLCARVDPDTISLLGRWHSDAMLRYLRTQALQITNYNSQLMLQHGSYTYGPTTNVNAPLPTETPRDIADALSQAPSIVLD